MTTANIILEIKGIYWGNHGNTPYGASIRLIVREVRLIPIEYNNTSFLIDGGDEDDGEEEEVSFNNDRSVLQILGGEGESDEEEVKRTPIPTPRERKQQT